MIRYLLADLDGTLLPIDLSFFFERYLNALTPHFQDWTDAPLFIKHLMASTMKMVQDSDPTLTNADVFWNDFPVRMGRDREELEPVFNNYYSTDFPKLKQYVPELSLARELMDKALDLGLELIIATNPIFPEMVIHERLKWIDCADLPLKFVTSLENMHYCKPNPLYFQEIIDRLSIQPDECLMVGNDMEEDLPAGLVGIKTFLVTDFLIDRGSGQFTPDYQGTLKELIDRLPELIKA